MSATPEKIAVRESPARPSDESLHSAGDSPASSGLSLAVMILVLGSSAGMLFYTKRTGSMLQSLRTITPGAEQRILRGPTKLGPHTKAEAEKLQPKVDKDEFF
jgi:hypothetical protein